MRRLPQMELATKMPIKLSHLKAGESAVINSISDNAFSSKLQEMGCVPGELISVKYTGLLGDPIAVIVKGYLLAMRRSEADSILVFREE